jgi:FKBP-type peptidyl-prolyl cis-trans isomerase 2
VVSVLGILLCLPVFCAVAEEPPGAGTPGDNRNSFAGQIGRGDMVSARVTITLAEGTVAYTSDPSVAESGDIRTIRGYSLPAQVQPDTVIAGAPSPVPGLSDGVIGMRPGEKKTVELPAEKAYGTRDPSKVHRYDRIRETPRTITMGPRDFVLRFDRFPVAGREVSLNPYFDSKIVEVQEDRVRLEHLAVPGVYPDDLGSTEISVQGDRIVLNLTPRVGASFAGEGSDGIISSSDDKTFTVDGNHPAAGHAVRVTIEVISVTGATDLKARELSWTEDHEEGLARAGREGKPAVLVLYLPECEWCHRLIDETFADPLVKPYRDDFVWIKVNSEEYPEYKDLYDLRNFPTTVLIRPDGTVIRKIEGFRDAGELIRELDLGHARTS